MVYLILHFFNCFYQFFPLHLQVHNGTEESIICDETRFNGSVVHGYLGVMTLTHDPQGACSHIVTKHCISCTHV